MRHRLSVVALTLVLAVGGACGGDGGNGATDDGKPSGPGGAVVDMKNLEFKPETITVKTGDTVTWRFNDSGILHNVVSEDFKSDNKAKGEFTYTFDKAGTVKYQCTLHAGMTGRVVVKD